MLDFIELKRTKVENQYRGAGDAFLVIENGLPSKLIYENPDIPSIRKELSEDDLFYLFADHGVDFCDLERKQGKILMGTCSCYQFVLPQIFIDTTQ